MSVRMLVLVIPVIMVFANAAWNGRAHSGNDHFLLRLVLCILSSVCLFALFLLCTGSVLLSVYGEEGNHSAISMIALCLASAFLSIAFIRETWPKGAAGGKQAQRKIDELLTALHILERKSEDGGLLQFFRYQKEIVKILEEYRFYDPYVSDPNLKPERLLQSERDTYQDRLCNAIDREKEMALRDMQSAYQNKKKARYEDFVSRIAAYAKHYDNSTAAYAEARKAELASAAGLSAPPYEKLPGSVKKANVNFVPEPRASVTNAPKYAAGSDMDRIHREKDRGSGFFATLLKGTVILLALALLFYLAIPLSGSLDGRIVEQHLDSDNRSITATIEITNHTNKLAQNVKASFEVTGENHAHCGGTSMDVSRFLLPNKSIQITISVPLETAATGSLNTQLSVKADPILRIHFWGVG